MIGFGKRRSESDGGELREKKSLWELNEDGEEKKKRA